MPKTPAEPTPEKQHVKEHAEKDYETEVLGATTPVVLDFYEPEGVACKALAPRFGAVAEKYEGKVRFLRVQRATNPGLAAKLEIKASPTLVFFKNGKEAGERLTGEDIKRTALKAQVDALLA